MPDILFITPNLSSAVKHEINGTMLLATMLLADGFDARILRYSEIEGYMTDYALFIEKMTDRILEQKPKSVAFYTIFSVYHIVLRLCVELKKRAPDLPLILGGPQSSALARQTMEDFPEVDFICTGEGDGTILPFMHTLLRGDGPDFSEIPGLFYRKDVGQILTNNLPVPISDLENLPDWDERLLMKEYTGPSEQRGPLAYYMPIDVGRGCPFNCTFCSTSFFWHRTYRLKSVERIMHDIRWFHDRFGYKSFLLSHDALTADGPRVEKLCDAIIESGLGIRWECSTRVDCLTPELAKKMKESGLTTVHMGIETGSERMQKLTRKNLDLSQAKSMIKALLDLKLHVVLFFVYGIPEETEADYNDTLKLIFELCDMGAPDIQLIMCLFTPGAEVGERCYDDLVFEPDTQAVNLNKFGISEERDMMRDHKPVFSTYYNLHTPLRDNHPRAKYLSLMYQKFQKTARYARALYQGDYLKFSRDFHHNNAELLSKGVVELEKVLEENPLSLFLNTLKDFDSREADIVRELLRFERDYKKIRRDPQDGEYQGEYAFNYFDYLTGHPIDRFSDATSKILIKKENKKVSMSLVDLR